VLSRMDIYTHSHAQFEDDTLGNIQPVKVMVEYVTKTAVEFPAKSFVIEKECTKIDEKSSNTQVRVFFADNFIGPEIVRSVSVDALRSLEHYVSCWFTSIRTFVVIA